MYVVKYKDRVVLGIIPWNNKYIMDVMRVRYRENIEIPYLEPEASEFPLQITDTIVIYPAEENRSSEINLMIESYYGPTWEFLENKVIAHYEIRPLSLDDAKINYKGKAALLRYPKEIQGTKVTLNGIEYSLETDRESRRKYLDKLISIGSQTVNWKFAEGWTTLNKQDFESIVAAIDAHVQSAFDEELGLITQINNALDVNTLLAIEALNLAPQNNLIIGLNNGI